MPRRKVTLVEPHRVKTIWRRGSQSEIIGTVRRSTPLHTQPIVAAKLQESLEGNCEIQVLDCRLEDSSEELYKTVSYGDGTLEHYRVGLSLDSERFGETVRTSDVLGVTVNFTQEACVAVDIARRAKQLNTTLSVVYGGSDVRARPHHYITHGSADAVVLGDGEFCGPPLIRALLNREPLNRIPSIAYVEDGTVQMHPERGIVPMEDVPLPAFDLVREQIPSWVESHEGDLPPGVEPPLAYVETSRGCHETCSFCYSASLKYRVMTSPRVDEYARHLRKSGIRALMMMSDNELTPLLMPRVPGCGGMSGRDLIIERYRIFREHGFPWEFSNGLQYSMFLSRGQLDEELIEEMFSNCYRLFTPIEDPLDMPYDKLFGIPSERRKSTATKTEIFQSHHVQVLARIAATGLRMMTFGLIIGWPGDTAERIKQVGERCKILKEAIQRANPSCQTLFTPFIGIPIPGTRNWFDYQRQGLIKEDVVTHPEAWQFGLTTYGNFEMVDQRLRLILELNGEEALHEWTSTGAYPHQNRGWAASESGGGRSRTE